MKSFLVFVKEVYGAHQGASSTLIGTIPTTKVGTEVGTLSVRITGKYEYKLTR